MAKHESPEPARRKAARRLLHPATHVAALISLHVIALTIIEKTHLVAFLPH